MYIIYTVTKILSMTFIPKVIWNAVYTQHSSARKLITFHTFFRLDTLYICHVLVTVYIHPSLCWNHFKVTPSRLFPISCPRHILLPHGLIHYFIIGGTGQQKFMMVIVNTCVVHLGTNKLYCTGNLHERVPFVQTKAIFTVFFLITAPLQ